MPLIKQTLQEAYADLESVRDAMATVSAFAVSGSSSQLTSSAAVLERSVTDAMGSSRAVQRLIRRLGAKNMPEASEKLSQCGSPEESRLMMRLHALVADTMKAQSGIETFINECLQSVLVAQAFMGNESHSRSGRLIGSA